jgi:hypothetical protein
MAKKHEESAVQATTTPAEVAPVIIPRAPVQQAPAPKEMLSDADRNAIELAKQRKIAATAEAKAAVAQADTASLAYQYVVLQVYHKLGLSNVDAISEEGQIIRGGAVQQAQ